MLVMHTGVTMKLMHTVKLALLYGYEIQCDVHGIDFMNMHKFQKDQWNYITRARSVWILWGWSKFHW
jgi:hypothetical protein